MVKPSKQKKMTTFSVKPSNALIDKNPQPAPPPVQRHSAVEPTSTTVKGKRRIVKAKTLPRAFSVKTVPRGMEDYY